MMNDEVPSVGGLCEQQYHGVVFLRSAGLNDPLGSWHDVFGNVYML